MTGRLIDLADRLQLMRQWANVTGQADDDLADAIEVIRAYHSLMEAVSRTEARRQRGSSWWGANYCPDSSVAEFGQAVLDGDL